MKNIPKNKVIVAEPIYKEIKRLQNIGYGTRAIAKEVGLTRTIVKRIFQELGLKNSKNVSRISFIYERKCPNCLLIKPVDNFYSSFNKNGTIYYHNICKVCNTILCNERRKNNLVNYYNREKEYRKNNQERINKNYNKYTAKRKINDPAFKLRRDMSSWIANILNDRGFCKKTSAFKNIGYTIDELISHIEKQFEPWMTWENRGRYNSKLWNNNDPSTWTWQLDHIIPHSQFNYKNVDDKEYKICWALNNLRPLSAKQNILDGVNRTRHKK